MTTKASVPASIRVFVSVLAVLFIFMTAMTGHHAIAVFAVAVYFGFPILILLERIRSRLNTCKGEYSQEDLDTLVVFELLPPFVCIWAERLPWYKWVLRKNNERETLERKSADTEWVKKTAEMFTRLLHQMEEEVVDMEHLPIGQLPSTPHFTGGVTSILKVSRSPEWERLSPRVVEALPGNFTGRLIEICIQQNKEEITVIYAMEVARIAIRRLLQEKSGDVRPEIRQILNYWAGYGDTISLGENRLDELLESWVKPMEGLRGLPLQEILAEMQKYFKQ